MRSKILFTFLITFSLSSLCWANTPKNAPEDDAGLLFEKGKGFYDSEDYVEATKWFMKAADAGNADAQYHLSLMYYNGYGFPENREKAVYYEMLAADQGHARAMYNLGVDYETGSGVPQNYKKAMEWYVKSSEAGDADASGAIGFMYFNGYGVPVDTEKGLQFLTKGVEGGSDYSARVLGLYYLGMPFENGVRTAPDYAKAQEMFEYAAKNGDTFSMLMLWNQYEARTFPLSDAEAYNWLLKAAETGDADAYYELARYYKRHASFGKAQNAMREAADKGSVVAKCHLGLAFYEGDGLWTGKPQDFDKAFEYLHSVEDQLADAAVIDEMKAGVFLTLGKCYRFGRGVKADADKADYFTNKAASYGSLDAINIQKILNL